MVQLLVAFHSSTELLLIEDGSIRTFSYKRPQTRAKSSFWPTGSVCPQPSSAGSPVLCRYSDYMFMTGVKVASFLCVKREKDEALKEANLQTQEMQQLQCFSSTEGWILPSACTPA